MSSSRRRQRSPSRRKLSTVTKQEDESLSMSPDEIDEVISLWYEAKEQAKILADKEQKYKRIIHKILNITGGDVIKGKDLKVTRRTQRRRFMDRSAMPVELVEKYSTIREIQALYITEL